MRRDRLRLGAGVWVWLAVALVLRLLAVRVASHFPPCCDAPDYVRHGASIALGHGYPPSNLVVDHVPTALRPPVYPFFLGGIFFATGVRLTAARLVQALLGTVFVALMGTFGWQLFGRRRIALAVLAISAVYPLFVFSPTTLLSETVFLPLEVAALVTAWRFRERPERTRWLVITAVLCGLGALTRQSGALLLLPAALAVITAVSGLHNRLRVALILAVASAATVAPWTIRNAVELHAFVPLGVQTGLQLSGIYNDESRTDKGGPAYWIPPSTDARDAPLFKKSGIDEVGLDHALRQNATRYARHHPGYVVQAVGLNSARMLEISGSHGLAVERLSLNFTSRMAWISRVGFYVLAALAIAGAFTQEVRRVPKWLWLGPLAFFAAGAVTAALVRYRFPVDPFLVLAAAPVVAKAWDRLRPMAPSPATDNGTRSVPV